MQKCAFFIPISQPGPHFPKATGSQDLIFKIPGTNPGYDIAMLLYTSIYIQIHCNGFALAISQQWGNMRLCLVHTERNRTFLVLGMMQTFNVFLVINLNKLSNIHALLTLTGCWTNKQVSGDLNSCDAHVTPLSWNVYPYDSVHMAIIGFELLSPGRCGAE